MLCRAGLQESWQLVLRTVVTQLVTSGPPASPGLSLGPCTLTHKAFVMRTLPVHVAAGCSAS